MAETIVNDSTTQLIDLANDIVSKCQGDNCNTSDETTTKIYQELSTLSQKQAGAVIAFLRLEPEFTITRELFDAYLNLSYSVSAVYSHQCGATGTPSGCITSSETVKSAQELLTDILTPILKIESGRFQTIFVLLFIGTISMLLFILFLMIGIIEIPFKARGVTKDEDDSDVKVKINASDNN